jgi:4-carboxymuconolactone decarboxylase
MDELRRKGLAKMNEVYGWEMPNVEGNDFFALTADHLFGTIWTRPGLSMRDKRLMTLMAIFLTHYLGFPLGSKLDGAITKVLKNRKKAAERGEGEDKKANVNAAVQMHSGGRIHDK